MSSSNANTTTEPPTKEEKQHAADVQLLLSMLDSYAEKPDMQHAADLMGLKKDATRKRFERLLNRFPNYYGKSSVNGSVAHPNKKATRGRSNNYKASSNDSTVNAGNSVNCGTSPINKKGKKKVPNKNITENSNEDAAEPGASGDGTILTTNAPTITTRVDATTFTSDAPTTTTANAPAPAVEPPVTPQPKRKSTTQIAAPVDPTANWKYTDPDVLAMTFDIKGRAEAKRKAFTDAGEAGPATKKAKTAATVTEDHATADEVDGFVHEEDDDTISAEESGIATEVDVASGDGAEEETDEATLAGATVLWNMSAQ